MRVTKMHGIGNDYVYVNGFEEQVADPPALARRVSDRHFGVGGDGLIIVQPPADDGNDCRMEMYNADGSRAQMCGNGVRCVAKFVLDRGIAKGPAVHVETDCGLRRIEAIADADGAATRFRVAMGRPALSQRTLPARVAAPDDGPAIDAPLPVPGVGAVRVTCVSMGNPHCIVRLDDRQPAALVRPLAELDLETIGPLFERHAAFPERVNTEFIVVRGPREIDFRVWERGSGETLACGTGACAAVVAGVVEGVLEREVTVHLRGGDLLVQWDEVGDDRDGGWGGEVFMTGAATEVFTAELDADWLRQN